MKIMKVLTTLKADTKELLDWKAHPENVFLVAIPLVIITLGLLITEAILQSLVGDPGYLIILLVFFPLGITLYYSCWKSMKAL